MTNNENQYPKKERQVWCDCCSKPWYRNEHTWCSRCLFALCNDHAVRIGTEKRTNYYCFRCALIELPGFMDRLERTNADLKSRLKNAPIDIVKKDPQNQGG